VPSGANSVRLLIMNPPLQWDFGILHWLPQIVIKLDVAVPRDMSPKSSAHCRSLSSAETCAAGVEGEAWSL
jgi:hypothetical protein